MRFVTSRGSEGRGRVFRVLSGGLSGLLIALWIAPHVQAQGYMSGAIIYDPSSGTEWTALSNGNGTYNYVSNSFTPGYNILRTGDFNGDGKADLIVYNTANGLGYILMGNGDGHYTSQSLSWGSGYDKVECGDLSADGKTDVVLYNSSNGTMYAEISNGAGGFAYTYSLVSSGYSFVRVADFTGDGKRDVFLYNKATGIEALGIGNGAGGFAFQSSPISAGYDRNDVGDLDGDGKMDVLLYNSASGAAAAGISDGLGGFRFTPYSWSPSFSAVNVADYTGDGKAEVTLYNKTTAVAYFGTRDAGGSFTFGSLFWSPGYDSVLSEDVNGDGKADVILYRSSDGTEHTGISNGSGANGFTYTYTLWSRYYAVSQCGGGVASCSATGSGSGPTVRLNVPGRSGSPYYVGDTFTVTITGGQPNQPVSVSGAPLDGAYTDWSGSYTTPLTTWGPGNVGSYNQVWKVGTVAATPTLVFQVLPASGLSVTCSADPSPGIAGSPVTFYANPSGGASPFRYSWSGAALGTGPRYTFIPPSTLQNPQTYTAYLTVWDSNNQSASTSCSMQVNPSSGVSYAYYVLPTLSADGTQVSAKGVLAVDASVACPYNISMCQVATHTYTGTVTLYGPGHRYLGTCNGGASQAAFLDASGSCDTPWVPIGDPGVYEADFSMTTWCSVAQAVIFTSALIQSFMDAEPPTTATISGPAGIPIGGSAQFTVTLNPSPSSSAVVVTVGTTTGSGTAQFADGSTSMTINSTQTITVKGISASSAANNIQLAAQIGRGGTILAQLKTTVVQVSIALRTSGQPSSDNAAAYRYAGIVGSDNLGSNIQPSSPNLCVEGVELVGTVTPSDFSGTITLRRNKITTSQFSGASGSVSVQPPPTGTDDSDPKNRDDDPQSKGPNGEPSNGKVYDLDAPGIGTADPSTIVRVRFNFLEYATLASDPSAVKIGQLNWFERSSCKVAPSGIGSVFSSDVTGDNQAGVGTTPLTWNLR